MAGWMNPPPVVLLSGSEGFLRRREIHKAVAAARVSGRTVEKVLGEDHEAIGGLIEGGMFGGATLGIVSKPDKIDPDLIDALLDDPDGSLCLVLHHEGKIRKGSVLAKISDRLKKQHRMVFDRPEQKHKVEDYVVKFVVKEAKRFGLEISADLAEALVSKVGTDLGVLHFELLKVEAYMDAEEAGTVVTPKLLVATMMRTGEADMVPLVDALGRADIRKVLRESSNLSLTLVGAESSQTLFACAWLGSAAIRWLHAASLHETGASVEEASLRMGMHAYVYKTFNLPIAKRWGRSQLIRLVKKLSRVETAATSGHISPWAELECALVGSCRAVVGGG